MPLSLGGGNSNVFYVHPENWGKLIQFEEHISEMGGFNHQPTNHIITQLAVYTTYVPLTVYIAFWRIIYYLPPFRGIRNNHWDIPFTPKKIPQAKTWFPTIRQNSGSKAELSDAAGIWKRKTSDLVSPWGGKSSPRHGHEEFLGSFLVGKKLHTWQFCWCPFWDGEMTLLNG